MQRVESGNPLFSSLSTLLFLQLERVETGVQAYNKQRPALCEVVHSHGQHGTVHLQQNLCFLRFPIQGHTNAHTRAEES